MSNRKTNKQTKNKAKQKTQQNKTKQQQKQNKNKKQNKTKQKKKNKTKSRSPWILHSYPGMNNDLSLSFILQFSLHWSTKNYCTHDLNSRDIFFLFLWTKTPCDKWTFRLSETVRKKLKTHILA